MGRRGAHPPGAGGARRAGAAGAQPGHPRLPRERARDERRSRPATSPPPRRASAPRWTSTAWSPRPRSTSATRSSAQGRLDEAVRTWEGLVETTPERAHLVLDRLRRIYQARGEPDRFLDLCRRLVAARPQNWRARLALGGALANRADRSCPALDQLLEALGHNPHGLTVHEAIWETLLQLDLEPRPGRALRAARQGRRLLPRPARLPALPLPQHRTAVAVPALPRVEQLRRGADRAGEGDGRVVGGASAPPQGSTEVLPYDSPPRSQAARARPAAPCRRAVVGSDDAIGQAGLVVDRPLRRQPGPGLVAVRRSRAISRSSCAAGWQATTTTTSKSRYQPVSKTSGISATPPARSCWPAKNAATPARHVRVDDALEIAAGGRVGEDDPAERRRGRAPRRRRATPVPKRATTSRRPALPAATASRARTSASTTGTPASRSVRRDGALAGRDAAGQGHPVHPAHGRAGAARSSAATTVLCSSMAMVNGPTPPGTGVSAPATASTAGWTSPSTRLPLSANCRRRGWPSG